MKNELHRTAAAVVLAAALAGCGSGRSGSIVVDWENYSPAVKTRIDRMAARGDCAGLQAEFMRADASDGAERSNADLMGYIDQLMLDAGCADGG